MTGGKTPAEAGIQLPETKVAAERGIMSGPLVSEDQHNNHNHHHRRSAGCLWKTDVVHVVLRLLCLLTSVTAVAFMTTAKEDATMSIYGFQLPVHSKWTFSDSFEYLVGVAAAAAAHSVLQLLINTSRLLRKSPVIPSRIHAWIIFAGDQAFAYAMMSAGSAAAGITNVNRTGIRHTVLPKFCNTLHSFCDRVAVSIAFTLVSCVLLATSAILDIIWLSKY